MKMSVGILLMMVLAMLSIVMMFAMLPVMMMLAMLMAVTAVVLFRFFEFLFLCIKSFIECGYVLVVL